MWLSSWRRWRSTQAPARGQIGLARTRPARQRPPQLEVLEDRTLLSVTPVNVPTWTNVGPMAINPTTDSTGPAGVTIDIGAVNGVAIDPRNPGRMFVGAVNGGIWYTTAGYNLANPFGAPSPN